MPDIQPSANPHPDSDEMHPAVFLGCIVFAALTWVGIALFIIRCTTPIP